MNATPVLVAVFDRSKNDTLTRFTNWTIHPTIVGTARRINSVRLVRNFANDSLRMWLHGLGVSERKRALTGRWPPPTRAW